MTFKEACQTGTILQDELIIDAHTHMGPWFNFHIPEDGSAGSMVHIMDLMGFDTAIVSPNIAIGPDYKKGNRDVAAAAAEFPRRVVPFITVNPNYGRQEMEEEIAYWEKETGIIAFKLHPGCHVYKASGPDYFPVYEYAQEHGLPILSHSWAGDAMGGPSFLSDVAGQFPDAAFIVAHSANGWQMVESGAEEVARRENVYLDLAGSGLIYGCIEEMVSKVGAERVLFGTDMPFIDPRPGFGRLLMSRLSDDEKRLILGLNAKRLFKLG